MNFLINSTLFNLTFIFISFCFNGLPSAEEALLIQNYLDSLPDLPDEQTNTFIQVISEESSASLLEPVPSESSTSLPEPVSAESITSLAELVSVGSTTSLPELVSEEPITSLVEPVSDYVSVIQIPEERKANAAGAIGNFLSLNSEYGDVTKIEYATDGEAIRFHTDRDRLLVVFVDEPDRCQIYDYTDSMDSTKKPTYLVTYVVTE